MNTIDNKTKSSARKLSAACNSQINHGFDVAAIWIDHPELPIAAHNLEEHCTEAVLSLGQMHQNSRWKLKVELHQPTIECLVRLAKALGTNIASSVTYVEIARDIFAKNSNKAQQLQNDLLNTCKLKSQQQPVMQVKTTWYYGRRSAQNGRRRKVLVIYADKPSKLNNARPLAGEPPVLHTELRCTGSAALADLGIVTVDDLIQFDHQKLWKEHLRLYPIPKPTELGRLLAKIAGADTAVSGTALRKRSARWIQKHSIDEIFLMHNALLSTPKLTTYLREVPFSDWLESEMN